jgi:hypothetical protein
MERCAICGKHAHPATSYLVGDPLCQRHLAEVARQLVRSERDPAPREDDDSELLAAA